MNCHVAHSCITPGTRYEAPSLSPHDYLILTIRGTPIYGRNPVRLPLAPSTLMHLPLGAPQADWLNPGPGDWEVLWVQFAMRPEWRVWWSYPAHESECSLVSLAPNLFANLRERFEELWQVHQQHNAAYRQERERNLIERIVLECVTHHPPPRSTEDPRMIDAREYLERNLRRPIGMPDLCEAVGMSRARLTHRFKQTYRQTPMMLLEKLRLDTAANYLASTDKPIAEIAALCGYQDPLYFSRRFRRHAALSPTEYRDRHTRSLTDVFT